MKINIEGKDYEITIENGVLTGNLCKADPLDNLPYVVCRTFSAGVFAGYLVSRNGKEAVMKDARRLWFWKGASSLSELAMHGVTCPLECKFPCPVDKIELTEVIEVIYATEKAKKCIVEVPEWKQRK